MTVMTAAAGAVFSLVRAVERLMMIVVLLLPYRNTFSAERLSLLYHGSLALNSRAKRIFLDKAPTLEYNPGCELTPRSSSGQGRRPFKAEITGSTPVRGTYF